jgi:hypothetical protein
MGGFEMQCTDDIIHRLNLSEIKRLIKKETIQVSSIDISEEEISDRTKTGQLGKLITCLQILWFVIQLIGRAVQHLSTTNLELFTLGIVVCSLGTYAAFWQRPQDIHLPITISVRKPFRDVFGKSISPRRSFSLSTKPPKRFSLSLCLSAVITAIFGTCHLIGWDFLYPSSVEQLLWRISSICCVLIPFLAVLLVLSINKDDHEILSPEWPARYLVTMSLIFLYALARVYLLVAVFTSLRSVPAGVYQTVNWSLYFPHL